MWTFSLITKHVMVGVLLPGHRIAIDLQELEDVLCFLPILGFLFGCERVIGNQ